MPDVLHTAHTYAHVCVAFNGIAWQDVTLLRASGYVNQLLTLVDLPGLAAAAAAADDGQLHAAAGPAAPDPAQLVAAAVARVAVHGPHQQH